MSLKHFVEEGKVFNLAMQALILVSLAAFCLETVPELSANDRHALHIFEIVAAVLFTIEYALRILVAEHRWRFIFSFYGLVDLVAFLPFYIATGVDLRAVRALRLLRVFRVLKFLRYTKAIDRFKQVFHELKDEMTVFLVVALLTVFLSSVGIYYFESEAQPQKFGSVFQCMWWAVVTLTTVGYGDVVPVTIGGRIFTSVILVLGVGIIAVPTGLFAAAMKRTHERDSKRDPGGFPAPHMRGMPYDFYPEGEPGRPLNRA
jgi:voltage-gated potassium channel